jgi:hypothetical protein
LQAGNDFSEALGGRSQFGLIAQGRHTFKVVYGKDRKGFVNGTKAANPFRQRAAGKNRQSSSTEWTMAKAVPAGVGNPWAENDSVSHLAQMTTSQSLSFETLHHAGKRERSPERLANDYW